MEKDIEIIEKYQNKLMKESLRNKGIVEIWDKIKIKILKGNKLTKLENAKLNIIKRGF